MSIVRIILAFAVTLSIYGGANYYIARRIYQWLNLFSPKMNALIFGGIYTFIALSMIARFSPIPSGVKEILGWLGSVWMGFFMYLLIFFIVTDLILLVGSLIKIIPTPIPQSLHFYSGLLVILLTTGLVGYGMYNATQIKHASYNIQMNESSLAANMKIVMVSDLHLGAINSEENLVKMVQEINDLEPDIVCLVGDIIDGDYHAIKNPSEASNLLNSINATHGVYASLGNHDAGSTFNEMIHFLEESNITLLNDDSVIIDNRMILVGRLDPSPIGDFGGLKRGDIADILSPLDTNMPIVIMDHNPINIGEYGENIDLVLSGHTHRGQMFPGSLITNAMYVVDYGHYQENPSSPHIIVSSGVSTWGPPMRIGTNNEIVSITLH